MMRVNVMESLGVLALLPLRVLGRGKETIAINCLNSQPILIFDQTMYMKPSALNRTVTNWFPIKSFIIQLPTSAQVACGLFFLGFFLLALRWSTYFDTKIEPGHHSILHQVGEI